MSQSTDQGCCESVEPDAVKVARPVLPGGDEETDPQGNAPCPYPTYGEFPPWHTLPAMSASQSETAAVWQTLLVDSRVVEFEDGVY